jgi:hypothetical protein
MNPKVTAEKTVQFALKAKVPAGKIVNAVMNPKVTAENTV